MFGKQMNLLYVAIVLKDDYVEPFMENEPKSK
jgi:hypothetical protein